MANEWLRLWHDMPNDPKWRTIARASGMPISLVQSTYLHLLVDASRNVTRGHANVTTEDLASALDVSMQEIDSILAAMQGRVLDGMLLLGWEKRQPKREESGNGNGGPKTAAQRKKEQRDREKAELELLNGSNDVTQCHAESRNVTLDKDKDKENTSTSEQSPDKQTRRKWGTPEDHKAAQWIFSMIRKLNGKAREPSWDSWANDIRLMRENDRRTHHEICDLFKRANADDFWKANILSPSKLREKWDSLAIKLSSSSLPSAADITAGWK